MSQFGNYQARPYQVLVSDVVTLEVRQHPLSAVATPENKEKTRRPVDPPPMVQLKVAQRHDPGSNYLVNPFLFMTASLVEAEEQENGEYRQLPGTQIIGNYVSSLHRVKDVDNKDGGFFVFGDMSCRNVGRYRFQFSLWDLEKDRNQVSLVTSIISKAFKVVSPKEFHGLSESTHLSRTFSDQGIRLRLRKEPRTITGSKRSWASSPRQTSSPAHQKIYDSGVHDGSYGYESTMMKRPRSDSDQNSYSFPAPPFSTSAVPQYSSNLQAGAGSAWPGHYQQGFHSDQATSFNGLVTHPQGHNISALEWQRQASQGPYSAPIEGRSFYFGSANTSRTLPIHQNPHLQHADQPYTALHPPTPISDPTMTPHAHQTPAEDMQSAAGEYTYLPQSVSATPHVYQAVPPHAQHAAYDHHIPSNIGKYEQGQYTNSHSVYPDPSRSAFSTHNSSISDADSSLAAGVLNRSFAPSNMSQSDSAYDPVMEQELRGFKQEPQPYPTPNQTSPLG